MSGDSATPLITINVWLAGRSYRISIDPAHEAGVRRAVKAADQKIADLRQHYAGRDDQDFLAMALLMYATENGKGETLVAEEELRDLLSKIDKALDGGEKS